MPNRFTVEETESLYEYAYDQGLKGVTIFRDGCKRLGVLNAEDEKKKKSPVAGEGLDRGEIVEINDDVIGKKKKADHRLRQPALHRAFRSVYGRFAGDVSEQGLHRRLQTTL